MKPTSDQDRIQRAVSSDGTEIAARVRGQGPPVVLLPAGPGDSELSWRHVVPFLSKQCTCYLLETRGRGESGDHPDHSPVRLVEDVVAFIERIGEPVGLVGWGSALWARVAAENTGLVSAVAAYEPGADEVMSEETVARLADAFTRVGELVSDGRLLDAAQTFVEHSGVIYTDEDLASGVPSEFWVASAPNLPIFFLEQQQAAQSEYSSPTDPSVLGTITVPLLLLHGSLSRPWFADSVRHVARHVANATVHQISDAAHFGPYTQPRAVTAEMIRFLTEKHALARSTHETGHQPA